MSRQRDRASPQPKTLEEMVRPYGVGTTVSFVDAEGARTTVSYDDLARRAATAADRLRQYGVRAGDCVALTVTNDLASVTAALGVWVAGGTLVSLPPRPGGARAEGLDRIGAVLAAMGCRHHVSAGDDDPSPAETTGVPLSALQGEEAGVPDPEPAVPDTALIQFTSGSRGAPKGVAIGRDTFLGHARMVAGYMTLDPAVDRVATWLPLYHDLGFVCFFSAPLYARTDQVHILPRSFVLNPSRWLTLLARERASVSGAPNFGYRLASRASYPDGLDLSRMKFTINAAERILWPDLEAFQQVAGARGFPWEAIVPAYGLAENTVGVSARLPGTGPVLGPDGHVSLGVPLPGSHFVVSEDRSPGTVLLGGDWLFDGYWTAEGFEPRPPGLFDTDDAAFLHDGELYVVGRQGEVASVGGHNVFAEDVEAASVTAGAPVVTGCAAFKHDRGGAGERFATVVEVSPRERARAGDIAAAVRTAVAEQIGSRPSPVLVVPSGAIPRTSSGKPRRGNLRAAVLGDELPEKRVYASLT